MASIIDAKEISSISQSLGEMLRYSININDNLVMLDNELNHIVNYIRIQNIRFEDKFVLHVHITEEAGHGKLLKLILQPVIENILLHGYRGISGKSPIDINASVVRECLLICIEDKGVGISAERLQYIENNINATYSQERSIGLRNVHLRIQLAFGQQYGLKMMSCEGIGTKVEIILPYIKG